MRSGAAAVERSLAGGAAVGLTEALIAGVGRAVGDAVGAAGALALGAGGTLAAASQPGGTGPGDAGTGPRGFGAAIRGLRTMPPGTWRSPRPMPARTPRRRTGRPCTADQRDQRVAAVAPHQKSTAETLSPYARENRSNVVGNAPDKAVERHDRAVTSRARLDLAAIALVVALREVDRQPLVQPVRRLVVRVVDRRVEDEVGQLVGDDDRRPRLSLISAGVIRANSVRMSAWAWPPTFSRVAGPSAS